MSQTIEFPKELQDLFASLMPKQASYRYYVPTKPANASRAKDKYFYTTSKVSHKGYGRFLSGVYRYNASKREWVAMKKAGHAKKKDAIARAYKLANNNA